jgi:hypothetical protein
MQCAASGVRRLALGRRIRMSSATWYSQLIGDEKSRVCFHKLSLSIVAEYVPGFIVATAP